MARFRDWFGEWTVFIVAGIALMVLAWQSGFLRIAWIALAALPIPIALLLVAVIAWNARLVWRRWLVRR